MKRKTIKDIAEIISGYSFRGAVPLSDNGGVQAVQVKDITDSGTIDIINLTPVDWKGAATDAFLQKNDVLLSVRGTEGSDLKVGMFSNEKIRAVATSSLYVFRLTDTAVLPEYLLCYLQSFYGQHSLRRLMNGATIQTISKKDLKELEIPIPTKRRQQLIIDTMNNITSQKNLHLKKIKLLETLADNIMTIYP